MAIRYARSLLRLAICAALLAALVLGTARPASASSIIYVNIAATGANKGTSWANAYKSLQKALTVAVAGQQIWVAKGTYKPTNGTDRTIQFVLKNGVPVYGGFAGTETLLGQRDWKTNVTTLSGNIGGSGTADNSYIVVNASNTNNTAVLDGFTVTGGHADGGNKGGGIAAQFASPILRNLIVRGNMASSGGGVFLDSGSAVVQHVTIAGNTAYFGGGIRIGYGGTPSLTNVVISGNSSTAEGGGMYNLGSPVLTRVTFKGNKVGVSSVGGGMYNIGGSPVLNRVTFSNNSASYGGGVFTSGGGGQFNHVLFISNKVSVQGGGLLTENSTATLNGVTFNGNSANRGGGMANLSGSNGTMSKLIFVNNSAAEGGGMYNKSSSPTLLDVTFSGNSAGLGGGGLYNDQSTAFEVVSRATFSGNTAAKGGGVYNTTSNPFFYNATFHANSATNQGGGMYSEFTSPSFTNVTFSANTAGSSGGAMYNVSSNPQIADGIFWGDTPQEMANPSPSLLNIADSIVKGGCPLNTTCTAVGNVDPVLGPLQKNGGFTKTRALLTGSSAVDNGGGNSTCQATDQRGVSRPQGIRCDIGAYEVRAQVFLSQPAYDGWITESSENSSIGGSTDSASTTMRMGDDDLNRQLRSLVSFDTSPLPDGVTVAVAELQMYSTTGAGTSPFSTHGTLVIDLAKPYFGAGLPLAPSDFQAAATVPAAGHVSSIEVYGFYFGVLSSLGRAAVNRKGTTQLRLRFGKDDNNDSSADYLAVYSGDSNLLLSQPALWVYYNP